MINDVSFADGFRSRSRESFRTLCMLVVAGFSLVNVAAANLMPDGLSIDEPALAPIVQAARQIWERSGLSDEQLSALDQLDYRISPLQANKLAKLTGTTIVLDDNADNYTWFVDLTPLEHEEFVSTETGLVAKPDSFAYGRIDLLSALLHEQGHALGLAGVMHDASDVMGEALSYDYRRLPRTMQAASAIPGSLATTQYLTTGSTGAGNEMENRQPFCTVNYCIAVSGTFPSGGGGGFGPFVSSAVDPMMGEIYMFGFTFPPSGYARCNGQLLPINLNQALWSILGTTYGGDGNSNFALPDLRGRVPVGAGQGAGLSAVALGEKLGAEYTPAPLVQHTHAYGGDTSSSTGSSVQLDNRMPGLGLTPLMDGNGEIRWFAGNFAPTPSVLAHGQLVPIGSSPAHLFLFSQMANTFGGNIQQGTFAFPDLRGRSVVGDGAGPGLTPRTVGDTFGSEEVTMAAANMAPHTHGIPGTADATSSAGGGSAMSNLGPSLVMKMFSIIGGQFPSQNLILSDALLETSQGVEAIQAEDLVPLHQAAIERWASAGLAETGLTTLREARIELEDLGRGVLGVVKAPGVITINQTAGGFAWLVDATPDTDDEFIVRHGASSLSASDPTAMRTVDLLTVILHEQGHLIGLHDLDQSDQLMSSHLGAGTRRLPEGIDLTHLQEDPVYPAYQISLDGYLGELKTFAVSGFQGGTPSSFQAADGTELTIALHTGVFALYGTIYGGDGQSDFAVPDFRGRVAVHSEGIGSSAGPGLENYPIGGTGGEESVTQTVSTMAAHTHDFPDPPLDFGDAPTAAQSGFSQDYPVTTADDGARHDPSGPTLGTRDAEAAGLPSTGALGDDADGSDDEDGVVVLTPIVAAASGNGIAVLTVDLQNADPTSNLLNVWVDWNRNGSWEDAGEQVFTDFDLGTSDGMQQLTLTVPQDAGSNLEAGVSYVRARISTAGGDASTGEAADGEVEDHQVAIEPSGGTVSVTLPSGAGTYDLVEDGGNVVLKFGSVVLMSVPITDLNRLVINSPPGEATVLNLQFGTGDFIPAGGLEFNGGFADGDSFIPTDANASYTSVSYGVGTITLDGKSFDYNL